MSFFKGSVTALLHGLGQHDDADHISRDGGENASSHQTDPPPWCQPQIGTEKDGRHEAGEQGLDAAARFVDADQAIA